MPIRIVVLMLIADKISATRYVSRKLQMETTELASGMRIKCTN